MRHRADGVGALASGTRSGSHRFDRSALLAALIAAASGVGGAFVGGYLANEGSKELRATERHDAARGATRVYQAQMRDLESKMTATLRVRHWVLLSRRGVGLPLSQQELVAAELSDQEWQDVTSGQVAYGFISDFYRTQLRRRANVYRTQLSGRANAFPLL